MYFQQKLKHYFKHILIYLKGVDRENVVKEAKDYIQAGNSNNAFQVISKDLSIEKSQETDTQKNDFRSKRICSIISNLNIIYSWIEYISYQMDSNF